MKKEDVFNKTSKEILAPALNDFVLWILDKAQNNGIRRLYFLARDGYLMYRCAGIYVERFHLPIECRYLCCSRYSLRLPMYHRDMGAALDYICRGGTEVTLDRILDRSGIKEEEKRITLERLGMTGQRKKPISYPHLKRIRQKLEDCPFFLKAVETNSREKLPSLLGYLEQEGLTEEGPIALVDSGWTGSMQKEICQALGILGKKERLTGYYWGLYELPEGIKRENYHCYYFSPEKAVTRADFTVMLAMAAGLEPDKSATVTPFSDDELIPAQQKPYILAAWRSGLTPIGGEFKPAEELTRSETALMIAKLLELNSDDSLSVFADAPSVPKEAVGAFAALYENGIMQPLDSGLLAPNDTLTREQAAVMLLNVMEYVEEKDSKSFWDRLFN